MHHLAEYLLGVVFVAQGLQSPSPVAPTLMGALVLLNTASAKGAMSAFRLVGRRLHRILDVVVIVVVVIVAVQPVFSIDNGTRLIMGFLAFALAMVCLNSDYSEPVKKVRGKKAKAAVEAASPAPAAARSEPDGSMSDTIGRTAGRLAGKGVNIYRDQKAKRQS